MYNMMKNLLAEHAIDIAESVTTSYDQENFEDILDQFDIALSEEDAKELLSRLHGACVEEIYKYAQEE